jgi:hypothetical protein
VGIRYYDHATPSILKKKLALTAPTSGGRAVSIVRSRTKATEFMARMVLEDFCDKPIVIQSYCAVVRLHGLRVKETDDLLREIE